VTGLGLSWTALPFAADTEGALRFTQPRRINKLLFGFMEKFPGTFEPLIYNFLTDHRSLLTLY